MPIPWAALAAPLLKAGLRRLLRARARAVVIKRIDQWLGQVAGLDEARRDALFRRLGFDPPRRRKAQGGDDFARPADEYFGGDWEKDS